MYKAGETATLTLTYLLLIAVGLLDVCQSCGTGYYSSNGVCQKCPKNCASCRSALSCTSCYAGYYGETCSEYCPQYCHNNMCNQTLGKCISCIEGYFNDGNSCSKCPKNCANCNSIQFCLICKSGYKGDICQDICFRCKRGTDCDKNTGYCDVDCVDGLSGELCDTPCDYKCKSCNRYKRQCVSCASDRYGPSCNEQCSETCYLNTCDDIYGNCTFGCIDGYWGETCEKTCSQQCNTHVCFQSDGECKNANTVHLTKNNALPVVIIAICVLLVASALMVNIMRRRKLIKFCNRIHCHFGKESTENTETEQLKPLKERKMNVQEDMEMSIGQAIDKTNVNEDIKQMPNESEKEITSGTSDVSKHKERGPQHEINELKASLDKQETLPLMHVTATETFDDNKEIVNVTVRMSKNMKTPYDEERYNYIEVTELMQYVAKKGNSEYIQEFQELSQVMHPRNEGNILAKSDMNELQNTIQLLRSSVIVDDEVSTNIDAWSTNAEPYAQKAYIAYMGPEVMWISSKRTFWKTVLQEECGTIVMLSTESASLPEEKCRCVPEKGYQCSEKYGDITIVCKGETNHGSYTVRTYAVMKRMKKRDVQRLHFTNWPSFGLPEDAVSFVDFVKHAKKINNHLQGPTLVFFSSGKDRTGIYIALDFLTKQGSDTGFVDIFGCVRQLREQSEKMIYDWKQYEFLHKALAISLSSTDNNRHEEAELSS